MIDRQADLLDDINFDPVAFVAAFESFCAASQCLFEKMARELAPALPRLAEVFRTVHKSRPVQNAMDMAVVVHYWRLPHGERRRHLVPVVRALSRWALRNRSWHGGWLILRAYLAPTYEEGASNA